MPDTERLMHKLYLCAHCLLEQASHGPHLLRIAPGRMNWMKAGPQNRLKKWPPSICHS